MRRKPGSLAPRVVGSLLSMSFAACSSSTGPVSIAASCTAIPIEQFTDGGIDRSSIPALTNPRVAGRLDAPEVGYILTTDPVIGIHFNGQPLAVPLKLLWYHEVVNLQVPGEQITVTYSPLTGSVKVFDPASSGAGAFEVSSYVLDSNLVMEDAGGTLFPQMVASATCGPRDGVPLLQIPYEVSSYFGWLASWPLTSIVSRVTGHDFLYTLYPYGGGYRIPTNPELFYPISGAIDPRRLPKEWVLGVPSPSGGVAYPLADLERVAREDQAGQQPIFVWAADEEVDGEPIVAFWNSLTFNALVYRRTVAGQTLTFEVVNGSRRDVETGSIWRYDGRAVAGPMEGAQLPRHSEAYHAFWFAWADVNPGTQIWTAPVGTSTAASTNAAPSATPLRWDVNEDLLRN